ncbi:MAG: hypothetical protein ACU0DJ_14095 [Paracoccus sp. (in: a-proteobacteria)]
MTAITCNDRVLHPVFAYCSDSISIPVPFLRSHAEEFVVGTRKLKKRLQAGTPAIRCLGTYIFWTVKPAGSAPAFLTRLLKKSYLRHEIRSSLALAINPVLQIPGGGARFFPCSRMNTHP